MAKRADGHVEVTLLIRRKLVSEVVDDASDRAPREPEVGGQVLLREEPNADALSGNAGAMSIALGRSNVAHASHRNPLLAICRRPADPSRRACDPWPEEPYQARFAGIGMSPIPHDPHPQS